MTPPRSEGFVRMPDAEFDARLQDLVELEERHPELFERIRLRHDGWLPHERALTLLHARDLALVDRADQVGEEGHGP